MKNFLQNIRVGFIVLILAILSEFAIANSVTPPVNKVYKNFSLNKMQKFMANDGNADVLLIQSALPWDSRADLEVLDKLGYTHNIVDMSQIDNVKLDDYQIVLIVNDQNQQFYDYYAEHYDAFANYVKRGGILVFFACDNGWARGNNITDLPGHIVVEDRYNPKNIVSDSTHPIVTGILTGKTDEPIENSDLYGNYCSHNYFKEDTLPENSKVIFRTDDEDKFPTLIEYSLGDGHVIASGLTWEFTYDKFTKKGEEYGFGRALPDIFKYAFVIASGKKEKTGYSIKKIYPDDNMINNESITYKQPGDIFDVVAKVSYEKGDKDNIDTNISLTIELSPITAFNLDNLKLFSRDSSYDLNLKAITNYTKEEKDGKLIITINDMDMISNKNNKECIVRTKINQDIPQNTKIKVKSSLLHANKIISSTNEIPEFVKIIKDGKLIFVNRELMYKKYIKNPKKKKGNNSLASMSAFWKELYSVAYSRNAIVYDIDKYNSNFASWDRSKIDYTKDFNTINKTTKELDSLIEKIIDRTKKNNNIGRDVVLIGDDTLIPFYRRFYYGDILIEDFGSYGTYSNAAKKGYYLSDEPYRRNGKGKNLHNIEVGRIMANSLDDITRFLATSNKTMSNSDNVVMLENAARDMELTPYVNKSIDKGYNIISSVNDVDFNVTSELYYNANRRGYGVITDDDANWNNSLKSLFTGSSKQNFDVFRMMSHGSIDETDASEFYYHVYFNSSNLKANSSDIIKHFKNNPPFFIFDNCLVGLPDGKSISKTVGSLGVRGMIASTTITNSHLGDIHTIQNENNRYRYRRTQETRAKDISNFNDQFYSEFINSNSAGLSLNRAIAKYENTNDGIEEFQMNLYGLPWTKIKNPKMRIGYFKSPVNAKMVKRQIRTINNAGNSNVSQEVKFETYKTEEVEEGKYTVVSIPNTWLLKKDEHTPVLPMVEKSFEIPKDAKVSNINIKSSEKINLGKVEIPAYHFAPQVVNATDFSHYVSLPSDIGVFPKKLYSYRIAELDNKKIVYVTLYPVEHDANSKETFLYKKFTINFEYESNILGSVNTLAINKDNYSTNENAWIVAEIQNMTKKQENYTIEYSIVNENGDEVASDSKIVSVDADTATKGKVTFITPSIPGKYTISVKVIDSNDNTISSEENIFRVNRIQLVNFKAPLKLKLGKLSTFEVEFENISGESINANISISIYDGNNLLAKLPQITINDINSKDIIKKEIQWIPDRKRINQGIYLVVASVFNKKEKILSSPKKIYLSDGSFDFNQDGKVDNEDLLLLENSWGYQVGEDKYSYEYDIDLDGDISVIDIMSMVKVMK